MSERYRFVSAVANNNIEWVSNETKYRCFSSRIYLRFYRISGFTLSKILMQMQYWICNITLIKSHVGYFITFLNFFIWVQKLNQIS